MRLPRLSHPLHRSSPGVGAFTLLEMVMSIGIIAIFLSVVMTTT